MNGNGPYGNNNNDNGYNGGNGSNPEVNPEFNFNSPNGYQYKGQHVNNGQNQYESVTPDSIWNSVPQNRKNNAPPMNVLSGISIAISLISVIITALALIFSWFFYVGFIMNIISAVLAVIGTTLGALSITTNKRAGIPSGEFPVIAIVLGIIAVLLSGVIFSCTGCAACFYCSSAV